MKQHIVLVHGASHGAWCWYKVVALLKAAGHRVTVPDLAASGIDMRSIDEVTSFEDYSQPLMEIMASLPRDEKVILVGHSLGGMNIGLAMDKFPEKVAAAVFVTALMPDCTTGPPSYVMDQFLLQHPVSSSGWMDTQFRLIGNGPLQSMTMGHNFMASKLYQHSPPEDLMLATTLVRSVLLFTNDVMASIPAFSKDRYGSVPCFYIVCGKDVLVPMEYQRWMIKNHPVEETMEIAEADHMAMLSRPQELSQCLLRIAEKKM